MMPDRMCSQRARLNSTKPVGATSSVSTIAIANPSVIAPRTVFNGFIGNSCKRVVCGALGNFGLWPGSQRSI